MVDFKEWLPTLATISSKIVIITDTTVKNLYAQKFAADLEAIGYEVLLLSFAPGEESKNFTILEYLLNEMLRHKIDRHSVCLAFGGGVVGDTTGLVSALFMRGIKYIQIPTTTLSMIDSSVGGKTAINSIHGKNMIGAFNQPNMVVMDVNLLKSLPDDQLVYGLVEAIKIFLTSDRKAFNYLTKNLAKILNKDHKYLVPVIKRAVRLKADVVRQDEREENLRMILNFGHTVGHAIEKLSKYKIAHGCAVALGILVEAKIAELAGLLSLDSFKQIEVLLVRLNITSTLLKSFNVEDMVSAMLLDKKNKDGEIYFVLLNDIGQVKLTQSGMVATPVSITEIHKALSAI